MIITLRIDGDSSSIVVFEEVNSNHTFGPKKAPNTNFFWMQWPLFNYMRILRTPNTTILFINILTEYEMCFIAEENYVRKIAAHRLLFKHLFHVSTML